MTITRLHTGAELTALVASTFPSMVAVADFLDAGDGFAFAAEDGGAPVGFAYGHLLPRTDGRRAVLLYEVEVDPAHRRRGIATALVAAVLQHGALNPSRCGCWPSRTTPPPAGSTRPQPAAAHRSSCTRGS